MYQFFKYLALILSIVFVILLIRYLFKKFKNPRIDYVNIIDGGVGRGKSSFAVCRSIWLLRRKYFLYKDGSITKGHNYNIICNVPFGKLHKNKKTKEYDYRYIKIYGHTIKCYDLTEDILLLKKRLPQDENIIIIQEAGKFCSSSMWKNPNLLNVAEYVSNFRHMYHGKSYIFMDDQRLSKIPLAIRESAGYCYHMVSSFKFPILPLTIFEYCSKVLDEGSTTNTMSATEATSESYLVKAIFFTNPFKYYDSFVYYERYWSIPVADLTFSLSGKRNSLFRLTAVKPTFYEPLRYDGFDEMSWYNFATQKR